jgi:O-antigen ligase
VTERFTFNSGRGGFVTKDRRPDAAAAQGTAAADVRGEKPGAENKDWAFLFLLAFTANVFLRPQDSIPGLSMLHLAEVCALGGLIALTLGRLSRGLPVSRVTPELVGVCALGVLIILLAPFSIWMGGAIGMFKDLYVKVLLIFLLMVNVLTSPRRIERLTWLLIVASGYIGFRAVLDYARGVNLVENGRVQGSIGGIFKNPNDLALNMVSLLPLALCIAMAPGRPARRLLAAACGFFMLGAVVASHSRSGTVGLAAMILVLACMAIRQRPGLVLGGALVAVLSLPLLPASYWHRLSSITDSSQDETGSREARETLLRESTQAFVENPLTGVGAGQFKNWNPEGRVEPWRESHDVFLQVAAELGLGGLLVFLFLIVRAGVSIVKTRGLVRRARAAAAAARTGRKAPTQPVPHIDANELAWVDAHSAAMMASLAGWVVCALFASVAYNWTFYYLLALAAAPRGVLVDRLPVRRTPTRGLAQSRLEVARV